MAFFKLMVKLGLLLSISGCVQLSTGFKKGEAFSSVSPDKQVVVGITHVTVKQESDLRDQFWDNTFNVVDSLSNYQGYLGHKLRKDIMGNEGWTMTVWEEEPQMLEFVSGSDHTRAIGKSIAAVEKARFVRATVAFSEIPLSWEKAEALMEEKGRELY